MTTRSTAWSASPSPPPKRRPAKSIDAGELEGDGRAWIDFRGPPDTFRQVSYSRVLRGKVPRLGLPRQDRRRRRLGALAAGRAPDLDHRRRADVRPRTAGQRDLDRRTRLSRSPPRAWSLDLLLILLLAVGTGGGDVAPEAARWRCSPRSASGSLYAAATQLAFNAGTVLPVVYPLLALVALRPRRARGQLRAQRLRAPARPRHLRPLRPRGGRRRRARPHRRGPALRRGAARGHRPLQRPARLHQLLPRRCTPIG